MPELPEVETMVRGIRPYAEGRRISAVKRCPCQCRPLSIQPSFARLASVMKQQTISRVRRLGKRVVLDLENQSSVVIEPRMTGLMLLDNAPDEGHLRIEWQLEGSRTYNSLWFWDRRGLGTIRLFGRGQLDAHFGPDVLGPDALEMSVASWVERLHGTTRAIKVALLDQKLAAGIGNLYASEILHVSGIDPRRPAAKLKQPEIERLHQSVQQVLNKAIDYEGSTLGDGTYRNALSQSGRYQNEHRVYMREGERCLTCGAGKIQRLVQAQRSTFFCPCCQQ